MFNRFGRETRTVVHGALEQAAALGSPTIEAEHLLLALAADPRSAGGRLLRAEGLDEQRVLAALERENELSLAAGGVAIGDFELPPRPPAPRRSPRFATSAKRVLERAVKAATARGDRRITSVHVLIGLLRAEVGTVPRALAGVEVDRIALATRAERLLG
ncbi:MAG TPA: Clp protease N-terminal domain-containing protein [Conexibacter sp.]|nr:Clp protease N-terminal domain-containing protein [Conexibacter sp.]